ncbi:flagellin lysine-N-methylase [Lachnoclostridium phytofermentans]|uniref:FliB family protein n=1 Tax=Lachnoclostridium phytofermentans (strain ATCC 700394 / DSM 18823 / ISDg) TaxID=357809 RepID=A9KSQ9_LACP7|nr:flagellin lysine-N-methylase [Lachnoclostridium phytofermentans]ABX40703.1 FliB family protein [Lachnoclostridium phytofermentans ISDg]
MKILKPYYYDKFTCIGNKCPNTCCKGWRITVDDATYKAYKDVEGTFGKQLIQNIDCEGKVKKFILDSDMKCPFLNDNLLCDIYINLGEEFMCRTCKVYPRVIKVHADVIEQTLTLSCPEVSRLLISSNKVIDFKLEEETHSVFKSAKTMDDALLSCLLHVRSLIIDIMQKRHIKLYYRQLLIIIIADKVQTSLNKKDYNEAEVIIQRFYHEDIINLYIEQFKNIKENKKVKFDFISKLLEQIISCFLDKDKYISQLYKKYLIDSGMTIESILGKYEEQFDQYYESHQYVYENFYVHTIFRYCLDALDDGDISKQVVLANIGYIIIHVFDIISWMDNNKELSIDNQSLIMGGFSFAFEHNPIKFNALNEFLEKNNLSSLAFQALMLT